MKSRYRSADEFFCVLVTFYSILQFENFNPFSLHFPKMSQQQGAHPQARRIRKPMNEEKPKLKTYSDIFPNTPEELMKEVEKLEKSNTSVRIIIDGRESLFRAPKIWTIEQAINHAYHMQFPNKIFHLDQYAITIGKLKIDKDYFLGNDTVQLKLRHNNRAICVFKRLCPLSMVQKTIQMYSSKDIEHMVFLFNEFLPMIKELEDDALVEQTEDILKAKDNE